ncbi:MAG: hypothetical protein ACJAXA_002879 [Candidatus Aldehydirespiratoraceae bacterium]
MASTSLHDGEESVLLIVSGTHGVEGYAGSALRSWWLDERSSGASLDGLRVVILHGFNRVGFSWVRPANEDNVDLNRYFVDWSSPPSNEAYSDVADLIVPELWSEDVQAAAAGALLGVASEVGLDRFQQIVSGGQYNHPTGIFHGGSGPAWSHRWLEQHLAELVGPAKRLGVIDLHTGLGEWGHVELLSHQSVGDPGYARGTSWWGQVRSMLDARWCERLGVAGR